MYGRQEIVAFLLDRGADLRDQSETGATALHWAAAGAHLSTAQLLIRRGAPLEDLNRWGGTVLQHAGWAFANGEAVTDYVPMFEALLTAGAKVDDGWLSWLQQQSGASEDTKARLAGLLATYKRA